MIDVFSYVIGVATVIAVGLPLAWIWQRRLRRRLQASEGSRKADESDLVSKLKHNVAMWKIFSDAMPIHVYIKNADNEFRYVYSNKTRNDFFGRTTDDLIGQNDTVLLSPEKAKKQLAEDAAIMTKPQGVYEGLVETSDSQGNPKCFRIAQTQFVDQNGTRLLLGAALDVTEQEESRRMLLESNRKIEEREFWLDRTLKSIGDAVIVTDKHGVTVMMNPVAERLIGIAAKDAVGRPHEEVFKIVGAQDGEQRQSPVARALRTGVIVELANHTDLISQDGEHYHIADSAAPILDEQGKVLGAVLVFRDVTEEYQRRAELRDAVRDWEMASDIGGVVSFRINYKTLAISGSKHLPDFWPSKNGKAIPTRDWIYPEDLGQWNDLLAEISSGRGMHSFYQYRAIKDGKMRHYRIFAAVDPERPDEITGIIQDMTEAFETEKSLKNTREMWNSLIDALPVSFFSKNADNHFRYQNCNQKFAQFVGRPVEEIIGRTDAEIFGHPDDSRQFEADDREIIASGKTRNFTEVAFGGSGQKLQLQTVKMPCIGPNGEHLLLGVSIDITEMVNLSKSQEVVKLGLETLVEESDVNVGISKALKSICEYIGVSRSYILHFNTNEKTVTCVREYCLPGEKNLLDQLKDLPYSSGIDWEKHFKNECFLNLPDLQSEESLRKLGPFYAEMIRRGDYRSLYCHRLIIDGKFWGYVGLAYEHEMRVLDKGELDFVQSAARFIELMIRHKRMVTALQEAVEQAKTSEKAKSNFLASMSHEIRTPLNAVIGYAELLKDGSLPQTEQKDYLNDISIAGNALLSLINDILDLSKLEAGKMCFTPKPTDFSVLLNEVMTIFRQKLQEKHISGTIDMRSMPQLKIDELRFRQILFNLIGNAVKFTDRGSITVAAAFTPDNERIGTLRFAVRDTGCGISEEDQKRLFQPFEQSRAILGTRTANAGTGLGLTLVRRMLDYMGGKITLDSSPGLGSSFTVTVRDIEYTRENGSNTSTKLPQEKEMQSVFPSLKVLLVDDVQMNLKVMHAMLKKLGVEAATAGNADEALCLLEKQPFDVLLTDLWMPGMNGAELAEKLRRSGKYSNLRIALLSADTEHGGNLSPGIFDEILTKPVSSGDLSKFLGRIQDASLNRKS